MPKKLDLVGKKFDRLEVLEFDHMTEKHQSCWKCKCNCGNIILVLGSYLTSGHTKSCGCLQVDSKIKHGESHSKLYKVWLGIRSRVGDIGIIEHINNKFIKSYINKGITICDEWREFNNFNEWALNNGYKDGLQIDRINNNAGYFPSNCRWVTPSINMRNRECTVKLDDGTSFSDLLDIFGVKARKERNKYTEMYRIRHKFHKELLFRIIISAVQYIKNQQ